MFFSLPGVQKGSSLSSWPSQESVYETQHRGRDPGCRHRGQEELSELCHRGRFWEFKKIRDILDSTNPIARFVTQLFFSDLKYQRFKPNIYKYLYIKYSFFVLFILPYFMFLVLG